MTGKMNTNNIVNQSLKKFVEKGLNPDRSKRFKNVSEMQIEFGNLTQKQPVNHHRIIMIHILVLIFTHYFSIIQFISCTLCTGANTTRQLYGGHWSRQQKSAAVLKSQHSTGRLYRKFGIAIHSASRGASIAGNTTMRRVFLLMIPAMRFKKSWMNYKN